MEVGFECMLSGPHGDFTCVDHPSNNLLMISGGSGVTPMMSMLRFLADLSAPANIVFINNVLTPSDIIFEKELMYLSSRFGEALKLGIVPTKLPIGQAWPSLVGPGMTAHCSHLRLTSWSGRRSSVVRPAMWILFVAPWRDWATPCTAFTKSVLVRPQ